MFKLSPECPSRAAEYKKRWFAVYIFAACLAVFFAAPGLAAVITVGSGETVYGPVLGTAQADEITVEAGGEVKEFVSGEGGDDVVINNGTVGWYMLGFELGEGGSPTVINNGLIKEDLLGTVDSRDNNTRAVVENHGTVEGLMIGGFASRGRFIVKNSGTVLWDIYGLASDFYIYQRPGQEFKVEIYNSGTVHGYIFGNFLDNGKVFIENTGTVMLDIYGTTLSLSDSVIVNKGTVVGSIYGGFGTDIITLVGGCSVGGVVDGFFGHDTLILDNMGLQDGSLWGSKYIDFENLSFTGADNRLSGSWQLGDVPVTVYGGSLTLLESASLYAASLDVQTGGAASLLGRASFAGAATVNGSLITRGYFSAGRLFVGSGGSAELYGETRISGGIANAGSLLAGGVLSAGHVESAGTLRVNGVLASPEVVITQSGELFGSGRIKGNIVNNGVINPGNSAGVLTIEGNYTHNQTAVMVTEAAADGGTDLLYVTDKAYLNGGTLSVSLEKALYPDKTSWTVIQADGGLYGNFDRMEGLQNSAVLTFETVATPNSLMLELNRKDYADFAANPNDARVARALDQVLPFATGQTKDMLMAMDWDMSASQIRRCLDELSPEMYTAFEPASLELGLVFDRAMAFRLEQLDFGRLSGPGAKRAASGTVMLAANRAGLSLPGQTEQPKGWAFWGRGLGLWSGRDSSRDYLGWNQSAGGAVLGVDAALGPRFAAGVSIGATRSDLTWTKEGLGGDMDGLHAGLYGRAIFGQGRLRGFVSYARLNANAEREVDYPGFSATAKGSFASDLFGARLEYGYGFRPGGWLLEPMASLGYQHLKRDDFIESGAGTLGLLIKGKSVDSLDSRLGARLSREFRAGSWVLAPRLGLFWVHAFNDDRPDLEASFSDNPSCCFTVEGAERMGDPVVLEAGLDADLNRRLALFADYGVGFASDASVQSFSAGLRFRF